MLKGNERSGLIYTLVTRELLDLSVIKYWSTEKLQSVLRDSYRKELEMNEEISADGLYMLKPAEYAKYTPFLKWLEKKQIPFCLLDGVWVLDHSSLLTAVGGESLDDILDFLSVKFNCPFQSFSLS